MNEQLTRAINLGVDLAYTEIFLRQEHTLNSLKKS